MSSGAQYFEQYLHRQKKVRREAVLLERLLVAPVEKLNVFRLLMWEEMSWTRGGGQQPTALDTARLMVDKQAYIAFLEAQLDKVSRACLQVDRMDERLLKVLATCS